MAILVQCTCGSRFRAPDRALAQSTKCPQCKAELVIRGKHVRNHDVFISYSSKNSDVALAVCRLLESHRVRCWIAPRNIPSGSEYADAIVDGIEGAGALLMVVSQAANASEFVRREVERAASKRVPIIPFRIEDVALSKALEFFLAGRHWHDALSEPMDGHVERLLPALHQLLRERDEAANNEGLAASESREPETRARPAAPVGTPTQVVQPSLPALSVATAGAVKAPSFHFGGVVPPEFFIGRDEELRQAERAVCGGNNMLLVGERRSGKTSFGKMLIHRIMGRPHNNVLGAYLNVQNWPELNVEEFFKHTVKAVTGEVARQVFGVKNRTLGESDPARGRPDLASDSAFASFLDVHRFVNSRTEPQSDGLPQVFRIEEFADMLKELVLCIHARGWQHCFVFYDEANRLGREQSVEMLLSHQEALSVSGLTAIYAASPAMVDSRRALQEWFVHQVRLGPFDSDEQMRRLLARYYFDDALRWPEVPASAEALDRLWKLSGGMPFLIQLIAEKSFDLAHRQGDGELAARHVAQAHTRLLQELPTAFTTGGD